MNRKIVLSLGKYLRRVQLCALCCILLSYSCSKNDGAEDSARGKDLEKPIPAPIALVPATIKSQNLLITFKYEAETNRLIELVQSDGWLSKFFYRPNGSLMEQEHYKNNKLQQSAGHTLNKEGLLDKLVLFDHTGSSNGFYAFVLDEEKRIIKINKHDIKGKLFEEQSISYNSLGNIIKTLTTNNGKTTTMSNTYDDRHGIYRNIPYFQLLFLVQPQQQSGTIFSNNNPLRIDYLPIGLPSTVYTYEYNSNGYPTSLEMTQGGVTETFKLTYKTIKPK